MKKVFTKNVAELHKAQDILFVKYHPKTIVNLENSIQLMQELDSLSGGNSYPILVDFDNIIYWTSDSRRFMAERQNNKSIKSMAIVASTHVHKIITTCYLKINKPNISTRLFNNEQEATIWLNTSITKALLDPI